MTAPQYKHQKWKRVTCPVLLAHGQNDTIVPKNHAKKIFKKLENVWKRFEVEGVGHHDVEVRSLPLIAHVSTGVLHSSIRRPRTIIWICWLSMLSISCLLEPQSNPKSLSPVRPPSRPQKLRSPDTFSLFRIFHRDPEPSRFEHPQSHRDGAIHKFVPIAGTVIFIRVLTIRGSVPNNELTMTILMTGLYGSIHN